MIDISDNCDDLMNNKIKNKIFECNIVENRYAFLTSVKYSKGFCENIYINNDYKTYFLYSVAKQMCLIRKNEYFKDLV